MPLSREQRGISHEMTGLDYQTGAASDSSAHYAPDSAMVPSQQGGYPGQAQGVVHPSGTGVPTGGSYGNQNITYQGAQPGVGAGAVAGGITSDHPTSYNDKYSYSGTPQVANSGIDTKHATRTEVKGKAEQVVGTILSSQSMKSKGAAKEEEAAAARHLAGNPR